MQNLKAALLLMLLLPTSWNLWAASFDPNTPVQIQSDTASIDQIKRLAIYSGNVVMTQGIQVLHADKITAQQDGGNVIIATGKPATFKGQRNNSPQPVYATAQTIYYYPDKQLLVLEGNALLQQAEDKFAAPILSYQIDTQMITANKQSNERPTITIYPKAKNDPKKKPQDQA